MWSRHSFIEDFFPGDNLSRNQNSFFPVGIKLWNTLDNSFKHVNTLSSTGDGYYNLIHSKMRLNCSPLKNILHIFTCYRKFNL